MALQVFESARAKIEASRGAGGTPVRILSFTDLSYPQTVNTIRPEEFRSNYSGFFQAAPGTEQNALQMSGNLDFSTAAWLGQVYVKGGVSATLATSVSGTAYTYSFVPSGTADDLSTLSVEAGYGDDAAATAAVRLAYVGGNELTLRFNKADSTITYDAGLLSASTATKIATFTGTPTSPTTTLLSTSTTQVYIDTGTIGTTADPQIMSAEWSLSNGWQPLYTLNNTTAAQAVYRPNHRTWTLRLTRYFKSGAQWDAYTAKTTQKIRVLTTGAALGTATYRMALDCYGVLTGREVADSDGLGVETLTYEPIYDTTLGADFSWSVTSADVSIT